MQSEWACRTATSKDYPELARLETTAFTQLGVKYYPLIDIQVALGSLDGLSLPLIEEGHYFVLTNKPGKIIASGGWSQAKPSYESHYSFSVDLEVQREASVRCVYVDPEFSGQGYAKIIMQKVEENAKLLGISRLKLLSSKTAFYLYRSVGFIEEKDCDIQLSNGNSITLHQMHKWIF